MRTFEHFPASQNCPVCLTTKDAECVLVPIPGTKGGGNVECRPFHSECLIRLASMSMEKPVTKDLGECVDGCMMNGKCKEENSGYYDEACPMDTEKCGLWREC